MAKKAKTAATHVASATTWAITIAHREVGNLKTTVQNFDELRRDRKTSSKPSVKGATRRLVATTK